MTSDIGYWLLVCLVAGVGLGMLVERLLYRIILGRK